MNIAETILADLHALPPGRFRAVTLSPEAWTEIRAMIRSAHDASGPRLALEAEQRPEYTLAGAALTECRNQRARYLIHTSAAAYLDHKKAFA